MPEQRDAQTEQRDALTELVRASVGTGRRMSTREFSAAAVDGETGWSPGKSLVAKIIGGQGYTVTPQLVSAVAVGLELPREVVAAAAHLQTIGYTVEELADGAPATLIRHLDAAAGPKSRAVAERWDAEAQ
ncbi:hypothetical protein [Streptomyces cyaneofuscatus]|uniref:hypothetical protein n=1 Tax=Streptomyces cyaneofuscatus TaxID=66883 RepID=UPI0038217929